MHILLVHAFHWNWTHKFGAISTMIYFFLLQEHKITSKWDNSVDKGFIYFHKKTKYVSWIIVNVEKSELWESGLIKKKTSSDVMSSVFDVQHCLIISNKLAFCTAVKESVGQQTVNPFILLSAWKHTILLLSVFSSKFPIVFARKIQRKCHPRHLVLLLHDFFFFSMSTL